MKPKTTLEILKSGFEKNHKDDYGYEAAVSVLNKQPKEFQLFLLKLLEKQILDFSVLSKCHKSNYYSNSSEVKIPTIIVEWKIGAVNSSAYSGQDISFSADKEPELEELDLILEEFWPEITYLQYKKLLRECLVAKTVVKTDYYMPDETWGLKEINLLTLFECINKCQK